MPKYFTYRWGQRAAVFDRNGRLYRVPLESFGEHIAEEHREYAFKPPVVHPRWGIIRDPVFAANQLVCRDELIERGLLDGDGYLVAEVDHDR